MNPRNGDVLVSKVSARIEHEVMVLPERRGSVCGNRRTAFAKASEMAKEHHVDAWLTVDHIHFVKIAAHRGDKVAARRGEAAKRR